MVLQDLADNISKAFKHLRKTLTIDDDQLKAVMEDIATALREADVPDDLVTQVKKNLTKRLLSDEFQRYTKKEQFCRHLVWKEICSLLNPGTEAFKPKKGKCNVLMFVGLQGSGKTTTIAKYAYYYKKRKWKCALVCCDTFRAGAFDQLKQNATKVGVPFYGSHTETDPVSLAVEGVKQFRDEQYELILVDTSGRHKQEKSLFAEMKQIEVALKPDDIVFIMDGTIGQAAMPQAQAFKDTVNVGSVIMTKLDGNTKGGGALAAVAATNSPITFIGYGEHFPEFEEFNPTGFSSRLLGYGDPQALMKRAEELGNEISEERQKEMFQRMVKGTFTMRDLHEQLSLVMKMGPIGEVMNLIAPGFNKLVKNQGETMEILFKKYLTIMDSMTDFELDHTDFTDLQKHASADSRARRLALGSGCSLDHVKQLFNQYKEFKKVFGVIGKRLNWKELKKHQNDPEALMKMMRGLIPGGTRNAMKMQKMYQQMSKMGVPKGMKMKFK